MFWQLHTDDLRMAYIGMAIISQTNYPNPVDNIRQICTSYWGGPKSVFISTHTSWRPVMVKVDYRDCDLIFMTGVRAPQHINNVLQGLQFCTPRNNAAPGFPHAFEAARDCLTHMGINPSNRTKPCRVYAHSYGGWCAIAMTWELACRDNRAPVWTTLYGSPRVGGQLMNDMMDRATITDWFTERDPVPYLIPNAAESPAGQSIIAQNNLANIELLRRPGNGIQVNDDRSITSRSMPSGVSQEATRDLLLWVSGIQGFLNPAHTHTHYKQQLAGALQLTGIDLTFAEATGATHQGNPAAVSGTAPGTSWGGEDESEPLVAQPITVELLPGQKVLPAPGIESVSGLNPTAAGRAGQYPIVIEGTTVGYSRTRSHARRAATKGRQLKLLLSGATDVDSGSVGEACT